jgi:hypothetical protein
MENGFSEIPEQETKLRIADSEGKAASAGILNEVRERLDLLIQNPEDGQLHVNVVWKLLNADEALGSDHPQVQALRAEFKRVAGVPAEEKKVVNVPSEQAEELAA